MTANSSSTSGIKVTSLNKLAKINASSDAFIYYTNLSKDWATKTNGTVDGEEYSSKYYAAKAKDEKDSAISYIDETKANFRQGIGLVKQDENNAIQTSTDGIYVDLSDLETDINSIESDIGVLSDLTTDTKTNIVAAINEHETIINQKINVNSAVVDGQWVRIWTSLAYGATYTAAQVVTYDLSSILPDDNYFYECLFTFYGRTGTTAGNICGCRLFAGTGSAGADYFCAYLGRVVTRVSGQSSIFAGNGTLPISPTDRAVTYYNEDGVGTTGTCGFYIVGYRRIGTNL